MEISRKNKLDPQNLISELPGQSYPWKQGQGPLTCQSEQSPRDTFVPEETLAPRHPDVNRVLYPSPATQKFIDAVLSGDAQFPMSLACVYLVPGSHVVAITGIQGERVSSMDPASGTIKHLTRRDFELASGHPDGKFVFYAAKEKGLKRCW